MKKVLWVYPDEKNFYWGGIVYPVMDKGYTYTPSKDVSPCDDGLVAAERPFTAMRHTTSGGFVSQIEAEVEKCYCCAGCTANVITQATLLHTPVDCHKEIWQLGFDLTLEMLNHLLEKDYYDAQAVQTMIDFVSQVQTEWQNRGYPANNISWIRKPERQASEWSRVSNGALGVVTHMMYMLFSNQCSDFADCLPANYNKFWVALGLTDTSILRLITKVNQRLEQELTTLFID